MPLLALCTFATSQCIELSYKRIPAQADQSEALLMPQILNKIALIINYVAAIASQRNSKEAILRERFNSDIIRPRGIFFDRKLKAVWPDTSLSAKTSLTQHTKL